MSGRGGWWTAPRRLIPHRRRLVALVLLSCVAAAACGKKGPPLPPLVRIPAPIDRIETRRVGDDVYVTFRLPAQNVDASTPPDVGRIDLFAVTASAPPPAAAFLEVASRVVSLPVAEPADVALADFLVPGGEVTLHETLTGAALTPRQPAAGDAIDTGDLRRFYTLAAYSVRGLTRGPGIIAAVPLGTLPPPPAGVRATHDAERLTVAWTPAAERPAGAVSAALTPDGDVVRYNVYQVAGPAAGLPGPADAPPVPVNTAPLAAAAFSEPVVFDGRERCYVVRTRLEVGGVPVESVASAPACVTPVDTFAPAPPRGLSAVALQGAISLIWAPNEEPDLDGYLVLRGAPGDATLAPLTGEPVRATQFVDRTVEPGRRYAYAVVAVDRAQPSPNVSAESNRVEETAR